jgi:hypothetical protein
VKVHRYLATLCERAATSWRFYEVDSGAGSLKFWHTFSGVTDVEDSKVVCFLVGQR